LELYDLTIHQAHDLLARREISSVELTQAVLDRIAAVDEKVKAYLLVLEEAALADAAAADRRRAQGEDHPLLGIPIAVKDVLSTRGIETTCGSRMLENFRPPYDATAIIKLREAGAVLVGKTNTDEFAMGSSTENSAFFTTHNPWDLTRVPGGSSGGSAAATAAGECIAAIGSDTGGSIRQPASFCGVVGIKPTYGRVSRHGLVAFASSLDQVGALGKDVTDCALLLQTLAGYDPMDSTSADLPVPDYQEHLKEGVAGLKLGVPREYFREGMQPEVEQAVRQALAVYESLGAELVDISMPHTDYCLSTYYVLAPAEASANLARFDGIRYGYSAPDAQDIWETYRKTRAEGFGPEVKRRIMLGTYALSTGYYDAYYLKAQKVRTLIKQDFDRAYEQVDAIVAPTAPLTAFRIGEKVDDLLQLYLVDILTLSTNLAGVCGVSVPCGMANGLPIGMQVLGDTYQEATVLRVAYAYEQAMDWHLRRPPL
jgi:aspartyl-tRNA(Asn)/glutamyl-tRNA(Gln) amidotransferase subunit A